MERQDTEGGPSEAIKKDIIVLHFIEKMALNRDEWRGKKGFM